MEKEFIVHDVIQTLYERGITRRESQEDCIKRYMQPEFISELEDLLKEYNVGYDCDFKELQKRIADEKDIYPIID